MFLGLTGGRAGGYGLVGACIDAGDERAMKIQHGKALTTYKRFRVADSSDME
jgi:hypothetical protein